MNKRFYITTTLPYVNADPHIGFALEIVRADAWSRFQRLQKKQVLFNTGTDEHGLKVYQKALELKLTPLAYCDQQLAKWRALKNILNLSYDNFIRTLDERHIKAVREFWRRSNASGYIYKKLYRIKYCVGCELEKTDSELVNGKCSLHPNRDIEIIEEENYFFRFSSFQKKLLKLYDKSTAFVVPEHRFNEIKKFVASGLEDFSISRLKKKMPWGIEVPGDNEQVIYVWFDALINYISTLGWPDDADNFKKWWPAIQVAGKDNLRQQSAMWQAMLMSAGLPPSRQILINSFLTSDGQKMSKSLGNVISPYQMVEKFGADGTRYLLLSLNTFGDDMDITWQAMTEKYNADLANGLGNLTARVANLLEKNAIAIKLKKTAKKSDAKQHNQAMNDFRFDEAIKLIWQELKKCDEKLSQNKPWTMTKRADIKKILQPIAQSIFDAAIKLRPLMPETAEKIINQFSEQQIKKGDNLFPRIQQ